jgi:hypothetical protein
MNLQLRIRQQELDQPMIGPVGCGMIAVDCLSGENRVKRPVRAYADAEQPK